MYSCSAVMPTLASSCSAGDRVRLRRIRCRGDVQPRRRLAAEGLGMAQFLVRSWDVPWRAWSITSPSIQPPSTST